MDTDDRGALMAYLLDYLDKGQEGFTVDKLRHTGHRFLSKFYALLGVNPSHFAEGTLFERVEDSLILLEAEGLLFTEERAEGVLVRSVPFGQVGQVSPTPYHERAIWRGCQWPVNCS